jgi:hypothetical protein
MALEDPRLCVFCGQYPDGKTREHVIPYWLLEYTGDPRRVVTFGRDFSRAYAPIRYSWSNFVAPACNSCNERFSALEAEVKPIIMALTGKEALPVSAYIKLLDWLDKVRIGAWLIRHMIEKQPIKIAPNFHISNRIGIKDRMVAVYSFDSTLKGITLGGTDSMIFNFMPSCWGMRINNIILFNISADWFCSAGCGLPHPGTFKTQMGGKHNGMMVASGFKYEPNISSPITDLALPKPVVWLYQPVKQPSDDPHFKGGYFGHTNPYDSRIESRAMVNNSSQCALFRQYSDRVEVLREPEQAIAFDQVVGTDCAMQKDIVASIYDAQIGLYNNVEREWVGRRETEADVRLRALEIRDAQELAAMYRNVAV